MASSRTASVIPDPSSTIRMNDCAPLRQTSIDTTVAPASMLLSTRSATALGRSYPMSRNEVISRAADGITVDLRGISTRLIDDGEGELRRLWSDAGAGGTPRSERALMTLERVGAADD